MIELQGGKYLINENRKRWNLSQRVLELKKSRKFIISNSLELAIKNKKDLPLK